MAQPEARDLMQSLGTGPGGYTDSFPVPSRSLSCVSQGDLSTCERFTHSKSQFKGQLLRGALLGTIPLPFLELLAHENFL